MFQSKKRRFEKIYNSQVDRIYRFVFLKVATKEIAEDLTAQVFTKGWERFRTGGKIRNPSAYLFQIARSQVADFYRTDSKYQIISTEVHLVVDPSLSAEQEQQKQLDLSALQKCLGQMPDNYQDVLILRYVNNCSHKEIAKVMDKTEGAVRVLAHRALKDLREKMTPHHFRPESGGGSS